MSVLRVLVADPQPIFRAGVANLLGSEGGFEVLGAENAQECLEVVARHDPDLVLLDLDLPPGGGLAALEELRRQWPGVAILWSVRPTRREVLAGLHAGASGYLGKEISHEGLVRALRGAGDGQVALSRELTRLVVEALHRAERRRSGAGDGLSTRELEVLDLVAAGARNRQIAETLLISEFTVKRHVQNILRKLELPSRYAAADYYRVNAALALSREPA